MASEEEYDGRMSRLYMIPTLTYGLIALTYACTASVAASGGAASQASSVDDTSAEPATGNAPESHTAPAAAAAQPSSPPENAAPNDEEIPPETRTRGAIAKVVRDHRQPVRECYQRARKAQPDLRGRLTIHFVLDPEGVVKSAEVNTEQTDLQSPDVAACAIQLIRGLQFPPSSRGMETDVDYPFEFAP
jgi:hypothetical protein